MTTYQPVGANKFSVPAGLPNERPDVVGDFTQLASDIDARLGVGGAEVAATAAAINAIPSARCFEGKTAIAADTTYRYRYTAGAWVLTSTPWANLTLGSGIVANTFGYAPSWRLSDGEAQLSGMLKKSSGAAFADGDAILTVPAAIVPLQTAYLVANGAGATFASLGVGSGTGAIAVHSVKGTAPLWLSLDSWRYRLR